MADCELIAGCVFFNDKMAHMPATSELMKDRYCHGDNSQCARYMVYQKLGRPKVPTDLNPGNIERAKKIISSK
jgi:hypothetical protein